MVQTASARMRELEYSQFCVHGEGEEREEEEEKENKAKRKNSVQSTATKMRTYCIAGDTSQIQPVYALSQLSRSRTQT